MSFKSPRFKILLGILGVLVFAGIVFGVYKFGQKPLQLVTCGPCPQFAPPHPDFCKDGTIIPGEKNECGCRMPPRCEKNSGQKVFCKEPRPEVCTMECIQNPPYICGSDGKLYCSECQACSNSKIEWYVIQEGFCES